MALCSIGIAAGIIGLVALVTRAVFYRRFGHGGGGCGPRVGALTGVTAGLRMTGEIAWYCVPGSSRVVTCWSCAVPCMPWT